MKFLNQLANSARHGWVGLAAGILNESTNKLIIRFRNRLGAMQVGEIALTEE